MKTRERVRDSIQRGEGDEHTTAFSTFRDVSIVAEKSWWLNQATGVGGSEGEGDNLPHERGIYATFLQ